MPDSFGGIEVEDEWGGIALEEESTPEERPPRGEMPPMPVFTGKPEVLVEGTTRATIPASLDVPVPSRVVAPFDIDEFSRTGTLENPYGVATPEERAFTAAQPSEFDRPVIPPGVFKTALDIGTMTMPRTELMEGFKEGTAEQLAGMTSQTSAAMLPAFMVPYVGPALAMGMGAKAVGEGAGATVAALEAGDVRGAGQGVSQVIGGGLMVAGGGTGARVAIRPAIPPRIIEAIAKADAVGLTKSAQAVADVALDTSISLSSERAAKGTQMERGEPRKTPGDNAGQTRGTGVDKPAPGTQKTEVITAEARSDNPVESRGQPLPSGESGASVLVGDDLGWTKVRTPADYGESAGTQAADIRTGSPQKSRQLGQQAGKSGGTISSGAPEATPGVAPEALGATARSVRDVRNAGAEAPSARQVPEVLQTELGDTTKSNVASVVKSITDLPDQAAGTLRQKPAVEAGMKLTEADVPALEAARDSALKQAVEAAERGDNEAFKAGFGKNIWFAGAIEGARRKGPNYDTFIKEQQAAAPTAPEAVPARPVSGRTAGQPAVGAAELPAQVVQPLPEPAGPKAGGEQPTPAASQATYAAGAKVIADKLRAQFKTETGGKAFTGPVEIINAAVEIAAKTIEYGGSAADAMAAALKHIRTNWKGEFDEAAFRTRFDAAIKVPDTAGETVKMRKSAERAVESPQIPKPVQERIDVAPESRYTQQSMARVEDAVKTMSDAELGSMPADSNLYVASKLEQADRRFRAGDNDGGYTIFVELEKQGTSFGQNINQFKRLAGTRPEHVATVIDKKLTAAGKDPLTPAQRTQAIETTRKSKEADLALDKATDAWQAKPSTENARRAEAALDRANAEAVELQKFVAKFEPRSTSGVLKSVLQGNLLTPISEVANLFGNMSFLPFRALDRAVGTGLDIIDSAVRGKPRELSVQPVAGTAEALKGVGRGLAKIPDILIEGTGNVIKGETRAGLHPIKAWINQFAKNPEMPTTGGKLTLWDRLNLAIEGTFGVPAEVMLRGLGAGDVPFKEAARGRVIAEQLKLNDVPREKWAFAQKFPELFLPKEALQQIQKDTMAAVFQRESKTLNLLTNWLKGKGEIVDLLTATVAPYKLTPWNIIGEILSYNPLIAMARGANDARVGNTRAAKLNAGKMVVGSLLTGTGIWLYKNGLLAPSLDERDESQKARVLSQKVLPPNHINISGLKRKMEGGDPSFRAGDETVDVFRAGGLAGAMFYMTANIGRDMERGPKATDSDMWMNIIRQSTLEQARFGLNQSFLSGVEGLLTAIKDGNADNYLRQWANTVGSIVLPNTLNTMSRAGRKYQVDVKADDFKGKVANIVKTKLGFAGLDDYLPLKRDFWGKPMLETPEGRDAIFYHFFDISKNKQVTSDPVELELYRLWRKTGDAAVIPSLPQRDVTFARTGYALNPQQYERYAELVGENRRNITDAIVVNPQFHKLDDEQKIKLLEQVYRDGMERGKALFYREEQGKLTPKQGRTGFEPTPNPNP